VSAKLTAADEAGAAVAAAAPLVEAALPWLWFCWGTAGEPIAAMPPPPPAPVPATATGAWDATAGDGEATATGTGAGAGAGAGAATGAVTAAGGSHWD
jgi:hypothetical protein